jgi:hypothetical protein
MKKSRIKSKKFVKYIKDMFNEMSLSLRFVSEFIDTSFYYYYFFFI